VVLGGGVQDAPEAARTLVERLGAMTVLTINANGVLPPAHPLSLGCTMPLQPVLDAMEQADVVLAIGTELSETDTLLFYSKLNLSGKVIRVDIDAEQLTRNALADVALCSDAGLAMTALYQALEDLQVDPGTRARVVEMRRELEQILLPEYRAHRRFLQTVQRALPDVVIAGDSTQPVYGGNLCYEAERPRSWFNSSTGYGTLGFGLPAALGAKLACPDRPVVALIGDGGIQFTIGELATAAELALPVPIIVWNNRGYGEIKKYMVERDIPCIGVDIHTPDFQTIARGFGCRATAVEDLETLRSELVSANEADGPTLIEIDDAVARTW
jgi:acetolactate synthase-1/2/3 large subunit